MDSDYADEFLSDPACGAGGFVADETGAAYSAVLIQWRLRQVERGLERTNQRLDDARRELEMDIATLATKDDVKAIKTAITDAESALQEQSNRRAEHRFDWWKTVLGGAAGATLAALAIFGIGSLFGVHLRN